MYIDKIRIKKTILSLITFPKPQTPYLVFEKFPFDKEEQPHLYIIDMKDKPFITLGRSNEANIRFTDISISRNHSKIRYHNDNFYIEDMHSKFGTMTMIKSDFIVLPKKKLTVQSGKLICEFNLVKNFRSTLCCYSNRFLDSLDYYKLFDEQKQEMHLQELKALQTLTGLDESEEDENINPLYNPTITKLLTNNKQFMTLKKNPTHMNNSDMLNLLNVNVKKQLFHQVNTVLVKRSKSKLNDMSKHEQLIQSNLTNRNIANCKNNVNSNITSIYNTNIRVLRPINKSQKRSENNSA